MIDPLPECKAKGQQFCGLCRDRERGRGFRETILRIRGVSAERDFECPEGKDWEVLRPPGSEPTEAEIRRASRNVGRCLTADDGKVCPALRKIREQALAVSCADCGCAKLSLLRGKCPRGEW